MATTNKKFEKKVWGVLTALVVLGSVAGVAGATDIEGYLSGQGSLSNETAKAGDMGPPVGADVDATLRASAQLEDALGKAMAAAAEIRAEGESMRAYVQQLEGQARTDVEARANQIVGDARQVESGIMPDLQATVEASMDLREAVENGSQARIEGALSHAIKTSAGAKATLGDAANEIDQIRFEARSVLESTPSTATANSSQLKTAIEEHARSILLQCDEFNGQVQAVAEAVEDLEAFANLSVSLKTPLADSVSAPTSVGGQLNGHVRGTGGVVPSVGG